jgi:hypothetical protein
MTDFAFGLYRGDVEIKATAHGLTVVAHLSGFIASREAEQYETRIADAYRVTYELFQSIEDGLPLGEIVPDNPFLGG